MDVCTQYALDVSTINLFIYIIYWAQDIGRLYNTCGRLSGRLHIPLDVCTLSFVDQVIWKLYVSRRERLHEIKNRRGSQGSVFSLQIHEVIDRCLDVPQQMCGMEP